MFEDVEMIRPSGGRGRHCSSFVVSSFSDVRHFIIIIITMPRTIMPTAMLTENININIELHGWIIDFIGYASAMARLRLTRFSKSTFLACKNIPVVAAKNV